MPSASVGISEKVLLLRNRCSPRGYNSRRLDRRKRLERIPQTQFPEHRVHLRRKRFSITRVFEFRRFAQRHAPPMARQTERNDGPGGPAAEYRDVKYHALIQKCVENYRHSDKIKRHLVRERHFFRKVYEP